MEILHAKNLTFQYPGMDEPAIKNVNLSLEKGDFVLLCGKSGCGKSTLLKLLKKESIPHGTLSGEVCVDAKNINEMSALESADTIAFVGQDPESQIITDKVWHELAFTAESMGFANAKIKRMISETAEYFGLQSMMENNTFSLSGGQKQTLNLASAMTMNPKILLLDEPTGKLDPISAQRLIDFVVRLNKDFGVTVIIAEHRYDLLLGVVSKVALFDNDALTTYHDMNQACEAMINAGLENGLPAYVRIWRRNSLIGNCPLTIRDGIAYSNKNKDLFTLTQENKLNFEKDTPSFELKNVSFRYERNADDAIRDVSFSVPECGATAIVGGNGAGKSTLLRLLAKLNQPYSGKIFLKGKKLSSFGREYYKIVSLLPQNPKLMFLKDTVKEDLLGACVESAKETAESKVKEVVKMCEIEHLVNRHPYDLSGGELQLCAIARILLAENDVLLLDEPTKGMDPEIKEKILEILRELKATKTVILVTHDIDFAADIADYCIFISGGQVVNCCTPNELFGGNRFYSTSISKTLSETVPGIVNNIQLEKALNHGK